jgi:hypothetical protein
MGDVYTLSMENGVFQGSASWKLLGRLKPFGTVDYILMHYKKYSLVSLFLIGALMNWTVRATMFTKLWYSAIDP